MHFVTQLVVIYYRDCRVQIGRGAKVAGTDSVGSAHTSIPLTTHPHLTQRKEPGEGGVADLPEVRMAESTGSLNTQVTESLCQRSHPGSQDLPQTQALYFTGNSNDRGGSRLGGKQQTSPGAKA